MILTVFEIQHFPEIESVDEHVDLQKDLFY